MNPLAMPVLIHDNLNFCVASYPSVEATSGSQNSKYPFVVLVNCGAELTVDGLNSSK